MVYILAVETKFKWFNCLVAVENIGFSMPCEGSVFSVTDVLQQDLLLQIPHISHVEKMERKPKFGALGILCVYFASLLDSFASPWNSHKEIS